MKTITKRYVLHLGYSCNARCRFCYYRESLDKGTVVDHTTEQLKQKLRIGRKYGKNEVDFSGGEPTIRKDLPELIQYARSIGYVTVCVITNGIRMHKKEYCQELIDAGLNDALVSLHSVRKELHEHLTCVPGSFDKLVQCMENLKALNFPFRINTTVSNLNCGDLDYYMAYVKKLQPEAVNFLIYNPAEECVTYTDDDLNISDYNVLADELKAAFTKHYADFKRINVRFLPFCLLKGFEDSIRTQWQKIYEREEWDPVMFMKFRKNNFYLAASFLLGLIPSLVNQPSFGKKSLYTWYAEVVEQGRIVHNKKHVKECGSCALRKICPGLPRAYVSKFNATKVHPYSGELIKDPLYYCRQYESSF